MHTHHHHNHGHSHQHGHAHGHHHHHQDLSTKRIKLALALNLSFAVIELFGGLWSHSVAVMSDALHDFGDCLSLIFAYILEKRAKRGANANFSYGMRRLSLLSAFITGSVLIIGAGLILYQAIPKLWNPTQPNTTGMIFLAVLGIAVNGYAASRTRHGATMNERVITWHLIEDLLGWIGILVGSIIMKFVNLPILDPLMAILLTTYVLWGVFRNLKQTLRLFLQGTPDTIDIKSLCAAFQAIPNVVGVHDVHLWSLDGDSHVLTVHTVVNGNSTMQQAEEVKREVKAVALKLGKFHTTVEIETDPNACAQSSCVGS